MQSTLPTSEPGPHFDYAPASSSGRRARLQKPLIIVAILIAAFFCRDWPSDIWLHCRLLYLYHQCLLHPISGGTIVYASGVSTTSVSSPQWNAFESVAYPIAPPSGSPIVFLGERETSDGERRLIAITASVNGTRGAGWYVGFETRSVRLAALEPLEQIVQGAGGLGVSPDPLMKPILPEIVVNAAVADPADPSHISFACRLYQTTYTVDAYLKSDGRFLITGMTPSQASSGPAPRGWSTQSYRQ